MLDKVGTMTMTHALAKLTLTIAAGAALLGATTRPAATRPAPTSRPTPAARPAPASRPAARAPDPLRAAIVALTKEGVDAARANKAFPRESSSYFGADVEIPPRDLLDALGRPLHANPRVDAYVKLQLLSAVSAFQGEDVVPAIKAYVLGAPAIVPMPILDAQVRGDWDGRQSQASDPDFVARANDAYDKQTDAGERADEIVIAYRDAMRDRIKVGDADRVRLFAAELEDMSQRAAGGLNVAKPFGKLAKEIEKWAAAAPPRAQVAQMLKIVDEYAQRHTSAVVYTKLAWNEKTRHAKWTTRPAALEPAKLAAIKADLLAAGRGGAN